MKEDFIFETDRLQIRNWKHTDAEAAFSIFSDPVVMRTYRNDGWTLASIEDLERFLRESGGASESDEHFVVTLKPHQELIGSLSCSELKDDFDRPSGEYEVTWILGRKYWGNGYATEAAKGFVNYVFANHRGLRRVIARCLPTHWQSRRVAEKVGMKYLCTSNLYGAGLLAVYELTNTILEVIW